MQKRWNIKKGKDENIAALTQSLKIHSALCKILVHRDIDTYEKAKSYFRPQLTDLHSPWTMKDMKAAVTRINSAINQNENILVFGDYDVDGTAAVASMYSFLKKAYTNVNFYIPNRYTEGYGVSKAGIDYAKENNFSLIISLDCGIKSVDLIIYARSIGIDFIVCDHHLPDSTLPPAIAILNPKQKDCLYPYKELCGCGVGLKLIHALSESWQQPSSAYLEFIDLAATAIAADIVPVTGENRVLVYYGLKKINENPSMGIKALMQLAGLQKQVHMNNLVFIVAPRINAAGRMDEARKAVQLFIEKDFNKALSYAEMLHKDNTDRKEADSSITQEALSIIRTNLQLIERKTTVIYREHWHKGVVGIVASRLIENYYRPTVVFTKSGDIVAGSARSVPGFNLYEAIHACKDSLIGYGGHFAAAGITLMENKVEQFINKFEEVVSATIPHELLIPEIIVDAEINFKDITTNFFNIINQMEPFGPGNMRPVFLTRNVKESGYSRLVKESHIKFVLKQDNYTFTGIGFNLADKFPILQNNLPINVIYTIDMNEWSGEQNLQLKVIDVRLADNTDY